MNRNSALLTLVCLASLGPDVLAIDHSNLDEGRPLRVEDAYPIAEGEWAVEAGAGFTVPRSGSTRGVFPVEVLYGAWPNFHLGLGSTLSTDPHEIDDPIKSGDLHLSGLYNFNQETLTLPAFGLKASANFPTGVGSSGVDGEIKGLLTKSVNRLSCHFNPGYQFLSGTGSKERDGIYQFVLGASYPIGAPRHTRTVLVADTFTAQSVRRGASNTFGAELGVRYQLTARMVLDAGIGSEFAGPADRAPFFFNTGISVGF